MADMKKVLLVAPLEANGRYKGGIMSMANALLNKKERFAEKGIQLCGFNTYIRPRKAETIGKLDMTNILNLFDVLKELLREIKKDDKTTVYYNTSIKNALLKDVCIGVLLKKLRPEIKLIYHIHFADLEKILPTSQILRKIILRGLGQKADKVVFLSLKTRDEFVAHGIPCKKCHVIYNFCADYISAYDYSQKIERTAEKSCLDMVFMASIDKRKGILDLLKAIKMCDFPLVLHICGICNDNEVKDEYQLLVSELGKQVIEHGYVEFEEKKNILKASDCMVLPTYGEGFPLTLIEEMAYAGSVITTPVGAIPEFFKDLDNGYLFQPGNIKELADCIKRMYEDRQTRVKQMKNNYEESKNYSIEMFIKRMAEVIE